MAEPTRFTDSPDQGPNQYVKTDKLEFTTGNIEKFVKDRGVHILWERAWLCTCRNPKTLAPKPNCNICHGRGIAYLPAYGDQMIIQSQGKGVSNQDIGLYDSGTAIGSTRLESKISFRDRITVPDVEIYQSLIFDITDRRVENGLYLSYDVKRLDLAMGDSGVELVEGQDFEIDYDNNMFYPKDHLVGTNVSLNLAVTLRYLVVDLLKESRYQYTSFGLPKEQFENLPRKLLLRREDIFVDSEPFSLSINTEERLKEMEDQGEQKMVDPKRKGNQGSGFFGGKLGG